MAAQPAREVTPPAAGEGDLAGGKKKKMLFGFILKKIIELTIHRPRAALRAREVQFLPN